jgi:hypothetical protein
MNIHTFYKLLQSFIIAALPGEHVVDFNKCSDEYLRMCAKSVLGEISKVDAIKYLRENCGEVEFKLSYNAALGHETLKALDTVSARQLLGLKHAKDITDVVTYNMRLMHERDANVLHFFKI